MRNGEPVLTRNARSGVMYGRRSCRNAAEEGGNDEESTARECAVVTDTRDVRLLAASAAWRDSMAGRSERSMVVSVPVSTSFPTVTAVMDVAGRWGKMLARTHAAAAEGSVASRGTRRSGRPTVKSAPEPANALSTRASAS
uniref:Uncharacterized protein n=1 Tax=Arundo donax TaxID=35708 RepID=A0A0A9D9Y2_ARUDO